jgi:competence protein ComFC
LDGVLIAADYDSEPIKSLIRAFKYNFARGIAPILGEYLFLFSQNISSRLLFTNKKSFDIRNIAKNGFMIPIPLHKKRYRWRGFNQSAEIAKITAERYGAELNNDLRRIKHRKPQSKLNKDKRKKMISGCFSWQGENLQGRRILLIDDVYTTGSTLNEAAKVLKENGAGKIWGMVLAGGK